MNKASSAFVWETHGIHVGTIVGPIKHGIDDLESAVERAIALGHPSICLIMHTPRLTTFRYRAEEDHERKFIRGDSAFARYVPLMRSLRERYKGRIDIRFGIELEWQGRGLGLAWSRAKIEQVLGVDFIVGSIHFSEERIGYDDCPEEAARLLALRGSVENYWEAYFDELMSMIDAWGEFIHAVGHLDLPKLYVPAPSALDDPGGSPAPVAVKLRRVLRKLGDRGIALDLNLAGHAKGCGVYPSDPILRLARELGVGISIGSDAHSLDDIGALHAFGLERARALGFSHYLNFRKGSPELRFLDGAGGGAGGDAGGDAGGEADLERFEMTLNAGLALLSQVTDPMRRRMDYGNVRIDLGEGLRRFSRCLPSSVVLGHGSSMTLRKDGRSITVGERDATPPTAFSGIYFKHHDRPGIIALLASVLASESVNVDTARLVNGTDGTGEVYLTVSGQDEETIGRACDFALGTNPEDFLSLEPHYRGEIPGSLRADFCILEMDDLPLAMMPARQMVYSVHEDRPGILFLLLAALAARGINVVDLALTRRPGFGHALLAVVGDDRAVRRALDSIGSEFASLVYLSLPD